ncbi:uncharacterized protein LOC131213378 [Anopheles bellator]|uniref:uncharacterized protein LOC131213378 n=1 Tax=Anopheles bellator TaxID=139047 RepID=UPI002648EDAE|nr:uncharacterized protein LOC131213378 [Anopheles bellator]
MAPQTETPATWLVLALLVVCSPLSSAKDHNYIVHPSADLECPGNVTDGRLLITAYRPQYESDRKRDYLDARHQKLYTLQEYLDDRAPYVTVGMDPLLRVPYGTEVCVPELNRHFRRPVQLRVCDTHEDLSGGGYRRLEICVRTQEDSYDDAVNLLQATLVLGTPDA